MLRGFVLGVLGTLAAIIYHAWLFVWMDRDGKR